MKTDTVKKEAAVKLRRKGRSIRDIENILGVARSTLSGWLRNTELTKQQKEKLRQKSLAHLVKARLKANEAHRKERLNRMKKIEHSIKKFTSNVTIDKKLGEIIFAIFYLAEGTRGRGRVEIANTNPNILTAFLNLFQYLYLPQKSRLHCRLNLRKDQSDEKLKDYWSNILHIPKSQFIKTQFDKRTIKPTFKDYKGVCSVYYCDTNLHKRILTIGEEILQLMNNNL